MPCPHCASADQLFNDDVARKELRKLQKRGPSGSTLLLLDILTDSGSPGSVLDIGGGVGAIQHALAERGASTVTGVDASRAYLATVRGEAERLGYGDRSEQHFGDFVELAPDVEAADIVTLDRVLCCYPDASALIGASAGKAATLYGIVFPKERWWTRLGSRTLNGWMALIRSDFRSYVHPESLVDEVVARADLAPLQKRSTWLWNVWVYRKVGI
jgi:magnesium-protoporphyrin O-methyltransferase